MEKKLDDKSFGNLSLNSFDDDYYKSLYGDMKRFGEFYFFGDNDFFKWLKKDENADLDETYTRRYYTSKFLNESFVRIVNECAEEENARYGTQESPIRADAYNKFAYWDEWEGGYVEKLGYVDEPAASVEYGCSLFLNSWIRRGETDNPVRISDFYRISEEGRWRGGTVETWDYVSPSTRILGSSMAFEKVNEGQGTIGSLVNLGRSLGVSFYVDGLMEEFKEYRQADGVTYEIPDGALQDFLNRNFYFKGKTDGEGVKKAILEHEAVFARIIKSDGRKSDVLVVDYNWLKENFIYISPVTNKEGVISEEDIKNRSIDVSFYILSKD